MNKHWIIVILGLLHSTAFAGRLSGPSIEVVYPNNTKPAYLQFDRRGSSTVSLLNRSGHGKQFYRGPISEVWLPEQIPSWGDSVINGKPPVPVSRLRSNAFAFLATDTLYFMTDSDPQRYFEIPLQSGAKLLNLNIVPTQERVESPDSWAVSVQTDKGSGTYVLYHDENFERKLLKISDIYTSDNPITVGSAFLVVTGSQFPPKLLPKDQRSDRFIPHDEYDPFLIKNSEDSNFKKQISSMIQKDVLDDVQAAPHGSAEIVTTSNEQFPIDAEGLKQPMVREKLRFLPDGTAQVFSALSDVNVGWESSFVGTVTDVWVSRGSIFRTTGKKPSNVRFMNSGYSSLIFASDKNIYFNLGSGQNSRLYEVPRPDGTAIVDVNLELTEELDGELSVQTQGAAVTYLVDQDGRFFLKDRTFHHGHDAQIEAELAATKATSKIQIPNPMGTDEAPTWSPRPIVSSGLKMKTPDGNFYVLSVSPRLIIEQSLSKLIVLDVLNNFGAHLISVTENSHYVAVGFDNNLVYVYIRNTSELVRTIQMPKDDILRAVKLTDATLALEGIDERHLYSTTTFGHRLVQTIGHGITCSGLLTSN